MDKKEAENKLDEYYSKLHEVSTNYINILNQRQYDEDTKIEKWIMTIASGSFGISFAFIGQIIELKTASHIEYLVASWICFLITIFAGIINFIISSFTHTLLAEKEIKDLTLRYDGIEPKYKKKKVFLSLGAIIQYFLIILLISGSVLLLLFIIKNLFN